METTFAQPHYRPLVALISDFGESDYYVAAMKAVLLRHCAEATVVDVTHRVPPQDVRAGAILVERAVASFAAGTVHLAVVDPEVGTNRRILIVQIGGQVVLCPDNGLITWAARRIGGKIDYAELTWRPPQAPSSVFHGRDIMAPAAGMVAAGRAVGELSRPVSDPMLLDDLVPSVGRSGRVIYIDGFGNAVTNIPADTVRAVAGKNVHLGARGTCPLGRTYADVEPGEAVALIGSGDLMEIAVRNGSAATVLGVRVGDEVRIAG
jgi:S-adenosylmethionine hydrolase